MKYFWKFSLCFIITIGTLAVFLTSCSGENSPASTTDAAAIHKVQRIVSLDGMITELLYQLNLGDQVVGIDVTSTYPSEELKDKTQLGHISQLNAEAILALSPDLIICKANDVNNAVITQLISSGIEVIGVTTSNYFSNSVSVAEQLQQKLSIADNLVAQLADQIAADSVRLTALLEETTHNPKVLFLYARGTGRLFVSGTGTPVAAMIEKAGSKNAVNGFSDYKELSTEALIAADPEVILMFDSGLKSLDGMAGLEQIPGMSQTKAFASQKVITMDGQYLSSFGPRAAQAALDLALQLQKGHQTAL